MILGIDLGTTNSLISYFDGEGSKIIPNKLGENLTPSVVAIDENGQVLVGKTAKEYGYLHPERVASVFKRTMGTDKKYSLFDKEYTSEELSAFVLRSLKEDAEAYLNEKIEEVVISVPAYFNDKRRKATKRAGELAGLRVDRIISEPTAAAIAYGLLNETDNASYLVFDLGGGTLDVSILDLFDNILEVRAVAGDNYLGGEDFTEVLVTYFVEENEIELEKITEKEYLAIKEAADEAKLNFSSMNEVTFEVSIGGEVKSAKITAEEYERCCEMLLERIKKPVQRSLADAHIKLSDLDQVVLVGGATKLPLVRNFITKLFKKFPDTSINPDEAIAKGAAIQAALKERNKAVKEVILTDVCSFTLGTEVSVERANGYYEAGHFLPIIDRNTIIPASRTERLYTLRDDQTDIRIKVLQGESRFAENNLLLGTMNIKVPKNKAGKEAVDITYTYDINSLLEVQVKIVSTGEVKKQIIKGEDNEMTDLEIRERMRELSYLKISPREQEENKLILLRGERLYEESSGRDRQVIDMWLREFEDVLKRQDRDEIDAARKELKEKFKNFAENRY